MHIVSVNVARAGDLFVEQSGYRHRIVTAIHKKPVAGAVAVGRLGLEGDEQADLSVHGGLDKAVYAYPAEHYPFWIAQRAAVFKTEQPLPPGSLGENLTIAGLLESDVWVGDRLQVGDVLLQVTEPRTPCFKFNAKMGFAHAARAMTQSGFTGFYLRVLQAGSVCAGAAIALLPGPRGMAVAAINERRRKGRQQDLF
jgi:MOSC domain-containing protein YiiM